MLLNHVRLVHIILIIVLIFQLQRIRAFQIIRELMLIRLFLSEDDTFAKIKHIVLFVEVDLRDLGHSFIQREHKVVLGETCPLLLICILAARLKH